MILKFTVNEKPYEIDMYRVMNVEAIAAQKVTGEPSWDDVLSKVDKGDATAITAIVWIALKRETPDLRFSDVEFPLREVWNSREFIDPEAAADDGSDVDPTTPASVTTESG